MNYSAEEIEEFWKNNPCGAQFVDQHEWERFFIEYDHFKYSNEPHILEELSQIDFEGKRVLEIGLGQGAEAQRIIQAGAIYNGIDLTEESVLRVRTRCGLFDLPFESIQVMNAEHMSFPNGSFDVVFSHGVIHHSPRIESIVREIRRVLREDGMFVVMLYNRNSINYHISIKILRRMGIFLLFVPGMVSIVSKLTNENIERLNKHVENLKRHGLKYLRMDTFIHKATDGPDNVFSSVFSEKEAVRLFSGFRNISCSKHYLNDRHFPILRNLISTAFKQKIASKFGWHLWVKGIK